MARSDVLTLAILGMLQDEPLHGYQIRKRLGSEIGAFRALSYGSLYPALKRMVADGLLATAGEDAGQGSKRSRISYHLTEAGEMRLREELAQVGASSWDDEAFELRFSLFDRVDKDTRLRILEGRRMRLTERLEEAGTRFRKVRDRHDAYTAELHRHGLETVEREVEWLDQLIDDERSARSGNNSAPADERESENHG